jgi:hypothetical protein
MALPDCDTRFESTSGGPEFLTEPLTLQAVMRQIRISRSTLGAVLDLLETAGLDCNSVEQIAEGAVNVTAETEQLWNLLK